MNILGLGGSTHDFAACLASGGQVVAYIEEERVIRKKHALHIGVQMRRCQSAKYCLEAAGLAEDELDAVVASDIVEPAFYAKYADRITLMNHHLSHAASAFYPSPFEKAAVLVADGRGSVTDAAAKRKETVTYYEGTGEGLREIHKVSGDENGDAIANSLGKFYEIATAAIGFGFLQDGKTMGLAAFGTKRFVAALGDYYRMDDEGNFIQTLAQSAAMHDFLQSAAEQGEQARRDIAYAAQLHLEQALIRACRYLHRATGAKHLCLAGGVALNSVANYKLLECTPFERIFVQPAAGDAGTAIGSALYLHHVRSGGARQAAAAPFSPYLGKAYPAADYERAIRARESEIIVSRPQRLYDEVAARLTGGQIVGWFDGRSEAGPRSLGNRSILADARHPGMKDALNLRVKHREPFRPFAPVVLERRQADYFRLDMPSYYMLIVPEIHAGRRAEIPSVTHADGTGRMQTVSAELNPHLHGLLLAFEQRTGTPVLLNTSFNDNGEPMVETPEDALACFLRIDLDCLVMNGCVITKAHRAGHAEVEAWR